MKVSPVTIQASVAMEKSEEDVGMLTTLVNSNV